MSVLFAFLTQISDRRLLAAPEGAAGRFAGIFGVGDDENLKFQVNPVQTGVVHAANVDLFRVFDPDLRSARIVSS